MPEATTVSLKIRPHTKRYIERQSESHNIAQVDVIDAMAESWRLHAQTGVVVGCIQIARRRLKRAARDRRTVSIK